jgi:phosphoribosylformimino-5-aminoimidazole carboxamide ribotide isomerase
VRVIPVVDLLASQVVRGVGGRRSEYRAIISRLAADAQPATVGRAFLSLGFREAYLADLDAIGGREPAWRSYEELIGCGLSLVIDAGLNCIEQARAMSRWATSSGAAVSIVAGLESSPDPDTLARMCVAVGSASLVFSLDLRAGVPITASPAWQGLTPEQVALAAIRAGVRRMIVLDLTAVGMGQGAGTEPLCRTIRGLAPELELIAGGGVRGPADLRSLAAAGCDAALVASALHDGRLRWRTARPYGETQRFSAV